MTLQQSVKSTNGEIQARCPACAAAGLDTKGEHLKVFADGKYACAANQGDKEHRKEIFKLAGVAERKDIVGNVPVKTFQVPASTVIMDLAQFSRFARYHLLTSLVPSVVEKLPPSFPDNPDGYFSHLLTDF